MDLQRLKELAPKRRRRKRVGCGPGSGHGKTACRGHKGQKSRSGGARPKHSFEGGSMPLFRRVPKRGFSNAPHKKVFEYVNVGSLAVFEAGTEVTAELLRARRLVRRNHPVKILGEGELDRPLTVKAAAFTKSAREKIEKAGGKAEVVG